MIKSFVIKLYPNQTMRRCLDGLCACRRYYWNLGLETWNDMYHKSLIMNDKSLRPTEYKVRNKLVQNKQDWEYQFSSRCLQLTIKDLAQMWQMFFDKSQPNWGKPKFKKGKEPRQGFKTDSAKIFNGKLRLDKGSKYKGNWYDIKFSGAKLADGKLKLAAIYCENGKYYANVSVDVQIKAKCKANRTTAVDVNVGHFNYTDGIIDVYPKKLQRLYQQINYYQKVLARKRQVNGELAYLSNNYVKTRAKLQRDYRKVARIQDDIIHKFTSKLIDNYDTIVIEDLNVKAMQMSHVASKGMHRSLFGKFKQYMIYKCDWYGKELILADPFYPSTQRCSKCGYVKQGDERITLYGNAKHHTKHNEYICYQCGNCMDRDENAVQNLLALAEN